MTKAELIAAIASESGLTQAQAKKALEATIKTMTRQLAQGGKVELTGFGSFRVLEMAERKGRNPQTGTSMVIPAQKRPDFNYSSVLKKAINGNG
jgi:DNA-binding protein HU-beta